MGNGDRMVKAWRGREMRGDGFAGLGGHSAYQESPELISRGSWMPCTPSLIYISILKVDAKRIFSLLKGLEYKLYPS